MKKLKKGSKEAKAFMARLRAMRGKGKRRSKNPRPRGSSEQQMARKRVAIKRQLRRQGVSIPDKASNDLRALRALRKRNPRRRARRSLKGVTVVRFKNPAFRKSRKRKRSGGFVLMTKHRGRRVYWKRGAIFDTDRSKGHGFKSQAQAFAVAHKLKRGQLRGKRLWIVTP